MRTIWKQVALEGAKKSWSDSDNSRSPSVVDISNEVSEESNEFI